MGLEDPCSAVKDSCPDILSQYWAQLGTGLVVLLEQVGGREVVLPSEAAEVVGGMEEGEWEILVEMEGEQHSSCGPGVRDY